MNIDRILSAANLALTAALLTAVLWIGGLPVRLSSDQRLILQPVVCKHGVQALTGKIIDKGAPCHKELSDMPTTEE